MTIDRENIDGILLLRAKQKAAIAAHLRGKFVAEKQATLPKTAAGWVSLVVFVALAGLTAYQATEGNWIAVALGALGALGTAINRGIFPNDKK